MPPTLGALYCETRGIQSNDFAKTLILESAPMPGWIYVWLILRVQPTQIKEDLSFIERFRTVTSIEELQREINLLAYYHRNGLSIWRKWLNLRVSGRQLRRIARELIG
ncbi:MAG: hypothetical protein M2R45_03857 [Verrucomicrobia subdivision 3 bacterium]|nr:hypothetical protein [Limisphaerales bacterium]MCS1415813.1 hypothetical protein [Limisphaerales bacterium]